MITDSITITLLVIDTLRDLGINSVIGGSLASAAYGMARSTLDADLIADIRREHVSALAQALQPAFYADETAIAEAVQRQTSFNLIHLESMFKVDVFIASARPFGRQQLARRQPMVVATEPERTADVLSPEDIILAKLDWYRQGGEQSERQWRDILGVLKAQADRLDLAYLADWAGRLNVSDLLTRARRETGSA
jgi:hypothetical protein